MTPYELQFLLHLRTSLDTPWPNDDTKIYIDMITRLEADGVIEVDSYAVTKRKLTKLGEAWVEVILNVPKPTPCFIDYAGKVVYV